MVRESGPDHACFWHIDNYPAAEGKGCCQKKFVHIFATINPLVLKQPLLAYYMNTHCIDFEYPLRRIEYFNNVFLRYFQNSCELIAPVHYHMTSKGVVPMFPLDSNQKQLDHSK